MTVEELTEQLKHSQNTINHLNDTIDRLVDQRDRVNGHIALYENHKRAEGVTLDAIRAVLR